MEWDEDQQCMACQRAIWVDGPDSEAARATRAKQAPDPWWAILAYVRNRYASDVVDASAEYMEGWRDACDGIEGRMLRLASQPTPDPTHTPAVGRVVAWERDFDLAGKRDIELSDVVDVARSTANFAIDPLGEWGTLRVDGYILAVDGELTPAGALVAAALALGVHR